MACVNGLLVEYKTKLPFHPVYNLVDVKECTKFELEKYTSGQQDLNTIQIIYSNFLQHLLECQSKIDMAAKSIYTEHALGVTQRLYEDFDKPSPLKEYISAEVEWNVEENSNSYHSNQHWRKLFSKEEAGIQSMLEPSSFDSQNLKAWDPIYLTLSYELFCLVINGLVMESDEYDDKSILYMENRHEGTYKRKYILYMNEVANSDMEFLLAVVSAFGINQSKYPSKLILILLKRKLLLEYYNNQVTEEDLNEVTNYLSAVIPTNSFEDESLCVTSELKPIATPNNVSPHTLETPTVANSSIATIGSEVNTTRAMTPLVPTATVSSSSSSKSVEKVNTISADEFSKYGTVVWNQFYGNSNSKPIPSKWYQSFASQFPKPNDTKHVLSTCIQQLLIDQKKTEKLSNWNILRFVDSYSEKLPSIEKNLRKVTNTEVKHIHDEMTGYSQLMSLNISLLQMALIPSNQRNDQYIPKPKEWCPSNCIIPFHGFQQHVNWVLNQTESLGRLNHLDMRIMRLRYAEYIFHTRYGKELILGLCTAYGPNIFHYPIRMLELLKDLEYLKPNTLFFNMVGKCTKGSKITYSDIFLPNHVFGVDEIDSKASSLSLGPQRPVSAASSITSLSLSMKSETSSVKSDKLETNSDRTASPSLSIVSVVSSTNQTNTAAPLTTGYSTASGNWTISEAEFFNAAVDYWSSFYGKMSSKPIPRKWYSKFTSQFPSPNDDNGILHECIQQLLEDKATRQTPSYRIIRIVDKFPDKLKPIKTDLLRFVETTLPLTHTTEEGEDFLMRHNISYLQIALVNQDMSGLKKSHSIPLPNEWCPSGSIFPFHGFQCHINWQLEKKRQNVRFEEVDIEVMRVRYVEYLDVLYRHSRQFLFGLFTAYGPNILNYPLRVLLILKKRNLLKSNTMLYEFIDMRCYKRQRYAQGILFYTKRFPSLLAEDSSDSRYCDNTQLAQSIGKKSTARTAASKLVVQHMENGSQKTDYSSVSTGNLTTTVTVSAAGAKAKDSRNSGCNLDAKLRDKKPIETALLNGNNSRTSISGSNPIVQLIENGYQESGHSTPPVGILNVHSSLSTSDSIPDTIESKYVTQQQHTNVEFMTLSNKSNILTTRVQPEASFSGNQSTSLATDESTMTTIMDSSEGFRNWKKACEAVLNDYGNPESSDFQIPEEFYRAVYSDYEKFRTAINAPNDQNIFHLFIHGALTGVQLSEFHQPPSYSRDSAVVGHAFQASLPPNQSEGFTLEEDSRMLLSQFFPHTTIYPLLNSFIDAKRKEEDVIDKILETFPGDKIEDFVRELSYHACFITNVEDIRFCTTLLQEFIRRDIISKAYVIHSFKTGVIQKLPELCAKVVQAISRLAEFLVEFFYDENDFCWFLTMTGGISKTYLPVWVDLLKTTVNLLKHRVSEDELVKLLQRTPGAVAFTQYMGI